MIVLIDGYKRLYFFISNKTMSKTYCVGGYLPQFIVPFDDEEFA